MTSYYSIIQVTTDPVADERVNLGLVAVGDDVTDGTVHFTQDLGRIARFLGGACGAADVETLIGGIRDDLAAVLAVPDAVVQLRRLAGRWQHTVRITEPRASLLDVADLVRAVVPRALPERPTATRRSAGNPRTKEIDMAGHDPRTWLAYMAEAAPRAHDRERATASLAELDAARAEIAELRAQANCGEGHDSRKICCAHAADVKALRAERDQLNDENLRLREQAGDMAEEIEHLDEGVRTWGRTVEQQQHLCAQVEDQLEAVNAECIRLNRELDAARAEVATLRAAKDAARADALRNPQRYTHLQQREAVVAVLAALDALPPTDETDSRPHEGEPCGWSSSGVHERGTGRDRDECYACDVLLAEPTDE